MCYIKDVLKVNSVRIFVQVRLHCLVFMIRIVRFVCLFSMIIAFMDVKKVSRKKNEIVAEQRSNHL